MIAGALDIRPDLVTLVPEKRRELTTEGGLDVVGQRTHLDKAVKKIHDGGMPVSLFIDPVMPDAEVSKEIGADMVEIHTGLYANSKGKAQDEELLRVIETVKGAHHARLLVNAGHGLNYFNVSRIAAISEIRGLYIGHSIVSRALLVGMERAVREMKALIQDARSER